ncbi:MAG: hypothetical protein JNK25_13545 [Phycisphaerae bacterium]|nr:hypothetical protein [Phycisphaerae bacterium]
MTSPDLDPSIPPERGGGPSLRLTSELPSRDVAAAEIGRCAWLTELAPLLPVSVRRECLDELEDHLRCRVNDLMLKGHSEQDAMRLACEELGDPAGIASGYRTELAKPRRRLAMNLSILGLSAAALVAGVTTLGTRPAPVPVSVFQAAVEPAEFLQAKVTTPKDATFAQLLESLGAPSKLTVEPVWSEFQAAGLSPESKLGFECSGLPVVTVLRNINDHLQEEQRFEFRVRDLRLIFAPTSFFDRTEQTLATYDLAGIVRARPDTSEAQVIEEAILLLTALIEPNIWRHNGGDLGEINSFGTKLFVRAPRRIHRHVEWVLSELPKADAPISQPGEIRLGVIPQRPEPTAAGESARIVTLQHAAADDAAAALSGVFAGATIKGVSMDAVRVRSMPQTNSLLILAGPKQQELLDGLIAEMERSAALRRAAAEAKEQASKAVK